MPSFACLKALKEMPSTILLAAALLAQMTLDLGRSSPSAFDAGRKT